MDYSRATDPRSDLKDALVQRKYDLLKHYDEAGLRMRIARRAGLPMSEVIKLWNEDDLACERAWEILEFERHMRTCPKCKTDPEDVVDDEGKDLDFGAIQVYVGDCRVCGETNKIESKFDDDDRRNGTYVATRPRPPGGPFVDS